MKRLLLVCLMLFPCLCAAAGLTIRSCYLYQETSADVNLPGGLRGSMVLGNETGLDLKRVKVTIHILDGYGRPITDLSVAEIPHLAAGQSQTMALYLSSYQGSVAIFQLSADVRAQSPQGPLTFSLPAQDATRPAPGT